MFPTHYTTDSAGKITFHYDKQEYKDWYKNDGGSILVHMDGLLSTYWDKRHGYKLEITLKHFPLFDGPAQPPEYYLKENAEPRMQKVYAKLWEDIQWVKPEAGHPDAWKHLDDLNTTQGT